MGVQGVTAWQEPRHFCDAEAVDSILLAGMVMSYANFSLIVEVWKWVLQYDICFKGKCFSANIIKAGFLQTFYFEILLY